MWLRALVAGGLLAGLLSACAVVDPVDSRYDTVSRSLAKARNEGIFLNLVRASHDYPLSFTTIANVTPTLTNTSTFALPTFSSGPPNCILAVLPGTSHTCSFATGVPGASTIFGSTTASNATAVSTNFNVATQETSAFYLGFLKPIDLQTLNYFIRQGYPRELLFWLFADSFQLQPTNAPLQGIGYQYLPPDSYGCPQHDPYKRCFRQWIWLSLLTGLTVEEQSIVKEKPAAAGGGGSGSKTETVVVARFCFSPELAHQAELQMGEARWKEIWTRYAHFPVNPSPICGTWTPKEAEQFSKLPQPDTFNFNVGPATFRIISRSAYGVFEFLGNIMKMQRENIPPTPEKAVYWHRPEVEGEETEIPPRMMTVDGTPPILWIERNSGADCFAHTWFADGDYCVPEAATTTKQIFSLMAQLIAIQTAASDLSITPVVRVIQ
jgi:hypothetical protein